MAAETINTHTWDATHLLCAAHRIASTRNKEARTRCVAMRSRCCHRVTRARRSNVVGIGERSSNNNNQPKTHTHTSTGRAATESADYSKTNITLMCSIMCVCVCATAHARRPAISRGQRCTIKSQVYTHTHSKKPYIIESYADAQK